MDALAVEWFEPSGGTGVGRNVLPGYTWQVTCLEGDRAACTRGGMYPAPCIDCTSVC